MVGGVVVVDNCHGVGRGSPEEIKNTQHGSDRRRARALPSACKTTQKQPPSLAHRLQPFAAATITAIARRSVCRETSVCARIRTATSHSHRRKLVHQMLRWIHRGTVCGPAALSLAVLLSLSLAGCQSVSDRCASCPWWWCRWDQVWSSPSAPFSSARALIWSSLFSLVCDVSATPYSGRPRWRWSSG